MANSITGGHRINWLLKRQGGSESILTVGETGKTSGKSSLINRLLKIDLLPVGTTPITAVPIHIVAGRTAGKRQ